MVLFHAFDFRSMALESSLHKILQILGSPVAVEVLSQVLSGCAGGSDCMILHGG